MVGAHTGSKVAQREKGKDLKHSVSMWATVYSRDDLTRTALLKNTSGFGSSHRVDDWWLTVWHSARLAPRHANNLFNSTRRPVERWTSHGFDFRTSLEKVSAILQHIMASYSPTVGRKCVKYLEFSAFLQLIIELRVCIWILCLKIREMAKINKSSSSHFLHKSHHKSSWNPCFSQSWHFTVTV